MPENRDFLCKRDVIFLQDCLTGALRQVKSVCRKHTKIELLHREGKLVAGLERCQCRKSRIQRNHIGCAFLVWGRLKELAVESGRTIYQFKHVLLDDSLIQRLKSPSLKMALA